MTVKADSPEPTGQAAGRSRPAPPSPPPCVRRAAGGSGSASASWSASSRRRYDRPIRQIDLADKDPVQRHERLAELADVVTRGSEEEPDDTLRARLIGLSVFLEGYAAPPSSEGGGT